MFCKSLFSSLLLASSVICFPALAESSNGIIGQVYSMTNSSQNNEIAIYDRLSDGSLVLKEYVSTGGMGSGGDEPLEAVDALGSQGPLVMTSDHRWLLAVNAGSDEVSVFQIAGSALTRVDKVASGGFFPASITVHNQLVYVLNSGGEGNFTGFVLQENGHLSPIVGSTRSLNVGGLNPPKFIVSPAQVGINPWGDLLFVTIKGSNEIRSYQLSADGMPSQTAVVTESNGKTPFGFTFDRMGNLIVVEPFGNADTIPTPNASAVSSYFVESNGTLRSISTTVENMQTASCWIARTRDGKFVYTTNNASNTITGYRVAVDGSLTLLNVDGVSAHTEENPVDITVTADGRFLYAVNAGSGTISMYAIEVVSGALLPLGSVPGLPVHDGAVGIVAN